MRCSLRVAMLLGALSVGALSCMPVHRPDGGYGILAERASAPDFHASDQQGRVRSLSEFRGRMVVLFFYPRDGTPGCTREACAFRDAWERLSSSGAQVLGVSTDDVASHARFAQERQLQFPLLADTNGDIARAYGVFRVLGMASRVTFLIDAQGQIAKVYPHVDPAVHATEVLEAISSLRPAGTVTSSTETL